MNIKDLAVPMGLAFVSVIALHYFFPSNSVKKEVLESSFIASSSRDEYRLSRPLNLNVDFFDQERAMEPVTTDIQTAWGALQFSTAGAALESVDFKHEAHGHNRTIRTIFPPAETEREKKCFLVGLQEKTPFFYKLVSAQENATAYELVYVGANDECTIKKMFTIDKQNPKIDLLVDVVSQRGKNNIIEPRIFFPAPIMPDLKDTDVISSVVIDQTHSFSKKTIAQLDTHRGWFKPDVFGSDNRYFIHTVIADDNNFAQRAYYKLEDKSQLISVLEGPAVSDNNSSWQLSFYIGPKNLHSIDAVDVRLEKTLDYSGILSSLAKLMLYILNWLYSYVHNYGLAIVLLTLLIQLLLLPVSLRNSEEKFKKQQMEYQRQLAYIEQRFKNQPEQLLAERTELIRKHGLPGFGCLLPLLIQLPIFFALSRVLSSSFELYQAPMLWIPDLSLRDPYFILPLLITAMMLLQDTKGDAQQRMSKAVMAVVFGVVTAGFSSGLALYILAGRVFGFIQSKLMNYFKLV